MIEKLITSPGFTSEDIHKIREWNYEWTKNMSVEEKVSYNNLGKETLYLNSIPGMAESIVEAGKEPLEECTIYDPNEEW